jgi:hypothetical protein
MLGVTLVQTAMYGEAIAEFQRARVLTGNSPEIFCLLGYGYGMAGMKREAQDVLKELNNLGRQNTYVSSFSRATVCIGLGETDPAFKWLEQAYQERLWYMTLLAVDPLLDRLRGDPRFTDLLRRMNLSRRLNRSRRRRGAVFCGKCGRQPTSLIEPLAGDPIVQRSPEPLRSPVTFEAP